MALSGLFLMLFLAQHFLSIGFGFSPDTFNSISHFMEITVSAVYSARAVEVQTGSNYWTTDGAAGVQMWASRVVW
jgi:hypothetical protein